MKIDYKKLRKSFTEVLNSYTKEELTDWLVREEILEECCRFGNLIEINVVIDTDYDEIETIEIPSNFTREQIRKYLNKIYGEKGWFAYDFDD